MAIYHIHWRSNNIHLSEIKDKQNIKILNFSQYHTEWHKPWRISTTLRPSTHAEVVNKYNWQTHVILVLTEISLGTC